jgi:hypothetical protein
MPELIILGQSWGFSGRKKPLTYHPFSPLPGEREEGRGVGVRGPFDMTDGGELPIP